MEEIEVPVVWILEREDMAQIRRDWCSLVESVVHFRLAT
jgi:DNA mismatch repair protein MutH